MVVSAVFHTNSCRLNSPCSFAVEETMWRTVAVVEQHTRSLKQCVEYHVQTRYKQSTYKQTINCIIEKSLHTTDTWFDRMNTYTCMYMSKQSGSNIQRKSCPIPWGYKILWSVSGFWILPKCRDGSSGKVQGVHTPHPPPHSPKMTCAFLI